MRMTLLLAGLLWATLGFAAGPPTTVYAIFELKKKAGPAAEATLAARVKAYGRSANRGKQRARTVTLTDGNKTKRYLTVRKFKTEAAGRAYLRQFRAALPKAERKLLKQGFVLSKRQYRRGKRMKSLRAAKGLK